jgi:hypothetical protein
VGQVEGDGLDLAVDDLQGDRILAQFEAVPKLQQLQAGGEAL